MTWTPDFAIHRDKSDSLSHGSTKKTPYCLVIFSLLVSANYEARVIQMWEPGMVEKRLALFLCLLVYMSIS
jgi:hypothetical protein